LVTNFNNMILEYSKVYLESCSIEHIIKILTLNVDKSLHAVINYWIIFIYINLSVINVQQYNNRVFEIVHIGVTLLSTFTTIP